MSHTLRLVGVDEAGRGPLAGPVVAAAVLLPADCTIDGLTDSKKLTARKRAELLSRIHLQAQDIGIGTASVAEIDQLNILHASMLAMERAVATLTQTFDEVWVDGNRLPNWPWPGRAVIGGDGQVAAISAASIVAKQHRDALMQQLDQQYPGYGFARHAGYPTAQHLQALHELGVCAEHRRSFAPVRRCLSASD